MTEVSPNIKPQDRVSLREKDTKDYKERFFKYYDNRCTDFIDANKARKCYNIVSGYYDEEEYSHIVNPLNTKDPKLKSFPAKIKNYPIVPPVFQMLLSEKREMLSMPIVVAENSEIDTIRNIIKSNLINKNLQLQFLNFINEIEGVEASPESVQSFEQIKEQISKIPDLQSELGYNILERLVRKHDIFAKIMLSFYYYVATGRTVTYKDIFNKRLFYTIVPPENVRYIKTPDLLFLEDAEAIIVRHKKTVNELYDMFQSSDEFESSGLKKFLDTNEANNLANEAGTFDNRVQTIHTLFSNIFKADTVNKVFKTGYSQGSGIIVDHLNARTQQKIGILKKRLPDGSIREIEVDERYIPLPNDDIIYEYKEQVFEGFRINGNIFIDIKPYPLAEYKEGKAKFPYNGRTQLTVANDPFTFAEISEPYQKSYNITKYKIELTLARNLDSLVVIPLGLMPEGEDWDEAKMLYYMQALSVLFVDETSENAQLALNALKSFNMSMWQYVVQAHQLLDNIVAQYHSSVGVNPQRMAQISQSAGKGTTDQAVYRSSLISLEMFSEFEEFESKEYDGLLRFGKYTISPDEKALYIKFNGKQGIIDTQNIDNFYDLNFSTHVSSSKKEKEKREMMKSQVFAFAQNQMAPSMVAKIIDADNNYAELIRYMDEMEETMIRRSQEGAQAEAEAEELKHKRAKELKAMEISADIYKVDANIIASAKQALDNSGVDVNKLKQQLDEVAQNLQKADTTRDKIDERAEKAEDRALKREEFKTKLQNKVVGEK